MRTLMLICFVVAACGEKKALEHVEVKLTNVPRCAPRATLVQPIAVYAKSGVGRLENFGAEVGNVEHQSTVTTNKAKQELTLKFGLCPNKPTSSMYSCASHNHDGVRYYAERKVTIDPADPSTMRAEFVVPEGPNALMCSDGKPATLTP